MNSKTILKNIPLPWRERVGVRGTYLAEQHPSSSPSPARGEGIKRLVWVACLGLGLGLLGLARVRPKLRPPPPPSVTITTGKPIYFHDEFIDIEARLEHFSTPPHLNPLPLPGGEGRVRGFENQLLSPLIVHVERSSQPVTTIGGLKEVLLRFPAGIAGQWPPPGGLKAQGRWPCPWNAPDGTYQLVLTSPTRPPPYLPLSQRGKEGDFSEPNPPSP
ncbi:MAG: hypothetical protein HYZ73_02175, partial [Elusimicrobia bacterium]|nr:hypothetical protein [Elusimicrobiota bacterium]